MTVTVDTVDNKVYNTLMSITFTKLFSSITESTIWCEPSEIRIVWITMLAMSDKEGRIWGSIPGLANRAQVSIESVESALTKFQSPDTYSRTKDFEGRRIEPIDGGWRLLNHGKYRAIRDTEERKAYKRQWIKDKREKDKAVDNVDQSRPQYTNTDTDTDTDTDTKPLKRKGFAPPSLDEVSQYCKQRGNTVDPETFVDFYSSKGWLVGKTKMKDWQASVRTWEKRETAEKKEAKDWDELARNNARPGESMAEFKRRWAKTN